MKSLSGFSGFILATAFVLPVFAGSLGLEAKSASVAQTIASTKEVVAPSDISRLIRLVEKTDERGTEKTVQIVVQDLGMSTDVSPRYMVYLGYSSFQEMGNVKVNFKINENALQFLGARRIAAGIYQIKVVEYRETGFFDVTQEVDARQIFADEKKLRASCGSDFCDGDLKSTVKISEISAVPHKE